MRTEAPPAPARAAETQPRRPQGPGRAPAAPADLFANLLQAAEPGPAATDAAAQQPNKSTAKQPKSDSEQAQPHALPGTDKHPALVPDKPLPPPSDAAGAPHSPSAAQQQGQLGLPAASGAQATAGAETLPNPSASGSSTGQAQGNASIALHPPSAAQQQGQLGLPAASGAQTAAGAETLPDPSETGTNPSQTPGNATTRQNPGAFVSTQARAQSKTAAMQASPKQLADLVQNLVQSSRAALAPGAAPAAQSTAAQALAWHMLAPGQPASALQEALGLGEEAGLDSGSFLSTLDRAGAGQGNSSGQGRDGGHGASGAPIDATSASLASSETSAAATEFSQQLGEALQPGLEAAYEAINTQISLWAAGQTKKANLQLQDGLRQTLEIELRLDGDQARIDFLTDDPQLRQTLLDQAQQVLGDLLERAGMELAGLSVGARTSDQSQGFARSQPEAAQRPREGLQASAEAPPPPPLQSRLPSGRSGLSVYA